MCWVMPRLHRRPPGFADGIEAGSCVAVIENCHRGPHGDHRRPANQVQLVRFPRSSRTVFLAASCDVVLPGPHSELIETVFDRGRDQGSAVTVAMIL